MDAVHGFALYGSFGNFGLNACRSQFGALGFGFVAAAVCACLDDDGLAAAFTAFGRGGFSCLSAQCCLCFAAFGFALSFTRLAVQYLLGGKFVVFVFIRLFAVVGFVFALRCAIRWRRGRGFVFRFFRFVNPGLFRFFGRIDGFGRFGRLNRFDFFLGRGLLLRRCGRRRCGLFRCQDFGSGKLFFDNRVFEVAFAVIFQHVNQAADNQCGQEEADNEAGKAFAVWFLCFHKLPFC